MLLDALYHAHRAVYSVHESPQALVVQWLYTQQLQQSVTRCDIKDVADRPTDDDVHLLTRRRRLASLTDRERQPNPSLPGQLIRIPNIKSRARFPSAVSANKQLALAYLKDPGDLCSSLVTNIFVNGKTVLDRGRTDRISLTHDIDLDL